MSSDGFVVSDPEVRDVMVRRLIEQRSPAGRYPADAIRRVSEVCGVDRSTVYRWCEKESSRRQPRAAWTLDKKARAAIIEANGNIALARDLLLNRGAAVKSRATFYRAKDREPDTALIPYAQVGAAALLSRRVALLRPRDRPNERWEIDHASLPIEVLLKAGDPTSVTLEITVVVDCDGGDILAHVLSYPKPTRGHVLSALRKAIGIYGIPNVVVCDNALTFTASAVRQAAEMLKFRVAPLPPYKPEGKGSVERAIGTIKTRFCPLQPFYTGGARRRDRTLYWSEASRLDVEQLIYRLDQFVDAHNTQVEVPQLQGRTRAAFRSEQAVAVRWASPEDLRTFTLERFSRVVRHDAGIWVDNVAFFAPELHSRVGQRIRVGMMPNDYTQLEVWDRAGNWLCTAAPTRTLDEDAREASRRRKAELNRQIGQLRRRENAERDRYAPITAEEPTPRLIGRSVVGVTNASDSRTSDPLGFGDEIGEVI